MKLPTELSLDEVNALLVYWGEQMVAPGNERGYHDPEAMIARLAELTAMRNEFQSAEQRQREQRDAKTATVQ